MSKVSNESVVDIKLINGKRVRIRKSKIVGYCKYMMHKGSLTQQLLIEHNCVEKNCKYLVKKKHAPFWMYKEIEEKRKNENKEQKKNKKIQEKENAERLNNIKQNVEAIVRKNGLNIVITNVVEYEKDKVKIFYVSHKRRDDSKDYQSLIDQMWVNHNLICKLIHTKDVEDNYITINEYIAIKHIKK